MANIGLIGLGLVGSALSERLLAAGHHVLGFDLDAGRMGVLRQLGGEPLDDAAAVASQVDCCLFSLPTSQIVETVLAQTAGHWTGKTIIDTTTGDPETSAQVGQALAQQGTSYLDATIIGSSRQVRAGEVVVLAGGDPGCYARSLPLLDCFTSRCFYLGSWGSGARMKLIVNLVLGLNRAVLAEGLSFARACGVDQRTALEVLQATLAYSRVMDTKGLKMIERDFTAEARLAQHHKDVRLILAAAQRAGLELPLSRQHDQLLTRAENLGLSGADNSAIIRVYDQE